mmetsp:Transcript_19014/g.42996  ORF Transcript_19014/g.42996 Transcript_19014/m.42996 type:complete len:500 (+) Transcript_19014:45-1544(+)
MLRSPAMAAHMAPAPELAAHDAGAPVERLSSIRLLSGASIFRRGNAQEDDVLDLLQTSEDFLGELLAQCGARLGSPDHVCFTATAGMRALQPGLPWAEVGSPADVVLVRQEVLDTTNLFWFHQYAEFEPLDLADGAFTRVRRLFETGLGTMLQYRFRPGPGEDVLVVAERLHSAVVDQNIGRVRNDKEAHQNPCPQAPHLEDALTDIGVLCFLQRCQDLPPSLPRLIGAFREHGPISITLVVTDLVDGDLFYYVQSGLLPPGEDTVKAVMRQLLPAVQYLDDRDIGHRDISLESISVNNHNGNGNPFQIKLMHFTQAVKTRTASGCSLRYFRQCGKPYYRAPEVYVPRAGELRVLAPFGADGGAVVFADCVDPAHRGWQPLVQLPLDAVEGQECQADVWGYEVPPVDVFAMGVCLFVLAYQIPPWQCAQQTDAIFHWVQRHGLTQLLVQWNRPLLSPEAMRLLSRMLSTNPAERCSVQDCLTDVWFADPAPAGAEIGAA